MKPPEYPVRPAFDLARDWRAQQEARLTDAQRARYEQIKREERRRQQAKEREHDALRAERVTQAKKRRLLERPQPVLRPRGARHPAKNADSSLSEATRTAKHEVAREEKTEMQRLAREGRQRADNYLRQIDRQRNAQPDRSAASDRTLSDAFRQAARRGGVGRPGHRGPGRER